jgi:hypothetical protein
MEPVRADWSTIMCMLIFAAGFEGQKNDDDLPAMMRHKIARRSRTSWIGKGPQQRSADF